MGSRIPYSPDLLFIIGMHRSGTSVVSRLSSLLGMKISNYLVPSDIANERGYWESQRLVELNEQLLSSLESSWFDPRPLPKEDLLSKAEGPIGTAAIELLLDEMNTDGKWVFKDPRLCRLLPFWLDVVKKIGGKVSFLLPYRHPMEVAASLAKRDTFPVDMGLHLWLIHTLEAEYYSRNLLRSFVSYNEILMDWKKVMGAAGETIGNDWSQPSSTAIAEATSYLSKDLCHFKGKNSRKFTKIEELALQVYRMLPAADEFFVDLDIARKKLISWNSVLEPTLTWLSSRAQKVKQLDNELKLMEKSVVENNHRGHLIDFLRLLLIHSVDRRLVIWGAGSSGQRTFHLLKEFGFSPDAFLDSDEKKWSEFLLGFPIESPEEALSKTHGIKPFVVVASMFSSEISRDLINLGYTPDTDFVINTLYSFKPSFIHKLVNNKYEKFNSSSSPRPFVVPYYIDPRVENNTYPNKDYKSIAIHIHLYSDEFITDIISRLGTLNSPLDIYISTPEVSGHKNLKNEVKKFIPHVKKVIVETVPNRGGSIAPMIIEFGKRLAQYNIIGHFYCPPKKENHSLHFWFEKILNNLIGEPKNSGGRISHIFDLLMDNANIIYSEGIAERKKDYTGWGNNYEKSEKFLEKHSMISIKDYPYIEFPEISMYWARSDCLKDYLLLPLSYEEFLLEPKCQTRNLLNVLERLLLIFAEQHRGKIYRLHKKDSISDYRYFEERRDYSSSIVHQDIKVLSYYLPQFHACIENDLWHGKGFTEWTNVLSANPLFEGHFQQRIPHPDLGYYLIDTPEIMKKQSDTMKTAGIYGQIFYHYWFSGKLILDKPARMLIENPDIEMPFCFCWANENWTKQWDGNQKEVLIEQKYSAEDASNFIKYLIPFFKDVRYIRMGNRPVLFVYRPSSIPHPKEYLDIWSKECKAVKIPPPYVVAVLTRGAINPYDFGMDAGAERVLHDWTGGALMPIENSLNNYQDLYGSVLRYEEIAKFYADQKAKKDFPYFRSLIPSWDNTARYGKKAFIAHESTPPLFQEWLEKIIYFTKKNEPKECRFVLINAWNEWAEGAYLEPDTRFGYGYLNSIGRTLSGIRYNTELNPKIAIPSSLKIYINFTDCLQSQLQIDDELRRRFIKCIQRSNVFKKLEVGTNLSEYFDSNFSTFKIDRMDANFILEFNHISFFDPMAIEQMVQSAIHHPESIIIPNILNSSSPLFNVIENGSVDSRSINFAPFYILPKNKENKEFKNVKKRTDAICFLTKPSNKLVLDRRTVTTIIRFHKSASFDLLKRALYCLSTMQDCKVIPLIAVQDLNQNQKKILEKIFIDIPFVNNVKPKIIYYNSQAGNEDLRSKMLNESLFIVKTRYVAFLDYDDLLMPHAYSWLIKRIVQTGKAISFGRVYETTYNGETNQILNRKKSFEYGYSYEDYLKNNHAPLHSFMLDLKKLNLKHIKHYNDQIYLEDYFLTLQLFTRENADWAGLQENMYIGDYIHSQDRQHTLAFVDKSKSRLLLKDDTYLYWQTVVNNLRQSLQDSFVNKSTIPNECGVKYNENN